VTIVASVKVRDGLILGTDSMTQITMRGAGAQVLKAYSNARKLFQIGHLPIGAMTYGAGNIGERSIEGIVLDFRRSIDPAAASVEEVAQRLYEYVRPLYAEAFGPLPADQQPVLGFFVAGYSDGAQFAEEFEFALPHDAAPRAPRGPQAFGASWRGINSPFMRIYKGYDGRVRDRLLERGLEEAAVNELLTDLETPVIYNGMPLQDAVNFCSYILHTTIGYTTFEVGVPTCGYPLQVATISADNGFEWVARPELSVSR
jgi:hypothetical protein